MTAEAGTGEACPVPTSITLLAVLALDLLDPDTLGWVIRLGAAVVVFAATVFALPWLRARAQRETNATRKAAYLWALDMLDAAIVPSVAAAEQTAAKRLRAELPLEGKLDAAQAAQVLAASMSATLSHLGDAQLDAIAAGLGRTRAELDAVIRTRTEAAVHELKSRAKGIATTATLELPGLG